MNNDQFVGIFCCEEMKRDISSFLEEEINFVKHYNPIVFMVYLMPSWYCPIWFMIYHEQQPDC